jgi:hypothetical protein
MVYGDFSWDLIINIPRNHGLVGHLPIFGTNFGVLNVRGMGC